MTSLLEVTKFSDRWDLAFNGRELDLTNYGELAMIRTALLLIAFY